MSNKILLYYLSIDQKLRANGPTLIVAKEQELEKKYYCRALVIARYYDADKEDPPTESAEVLDMTPPNYNYSLGQVGRTGTPNWGTVSTTTFPSDSTTMRWGTTTTTG